MDRACSGLDTVNMSILETCREALSDSNVQAFLRVIRAGETSQDDAAYRTIVGGGKFESFADHPAERIYIPSLRVWSTAAGAYQFLAGTWKECKDALGLPDFGPDSQDLAAVFLIRRRGALDDVIAGRLDQAIGKCAKEWASLPGSPYGQPVKSMAQCKTVYEQYGGKYAAQVAQGEVVQPVPPVQPPRPDQEPYVQPEATMPIPAIVAALLPTVIEAIPKLGSLFGSGSKVAERNVAAASTVLDIVQSATKSVNAQEAVERIKSDSVALSAATKAVEARWFDLVEGGGGGIDGARKADEAARAKGDLLQSPSFWVALALLPLAYLIVGAVVGLFGAPFSEDVRAAIANGVVGMVIGALAGYYFGQTTSRNRTPQA